jgi:plastocyanin
MSTGPNSISGKVIDMRTRTSQVVLLCTVFLLAIVLASCASGSVVTTTSSGDSGSSGTTVSTAGTGTATGGATVQVIMTNRAYDPATVTIKVGDTVTWVNQDAPQHDVVADNGEFKSELFDKGKTFSFIFREAGTYPYHCSIHPGMTGVVIAQ